MQSRTERYRELRNSIKNECYINKLEERISELEVLVSDLDCRLIMMEDFIAEEDEESCSCHCCGSCNDECLDADHRKQRGGTAPNTSSSDNDLNKIFDDLFNSINLIYRKDGK